VSSLAIVDHVASVFCVSSHRACPSPSIESLAHLLCGERDPVPESLCRLHCGSCSWVEDSLNDGVSMCSILMVDERDLWRELGSTSALHSDFPSEQQDSSSPLRRQQQNSEELKEAMVLREQLRLSRHVSAQLNTSSRCLRKPSYILPRPYRRHASSTADPGKPIVLEKPDKFRPPSHSQRLVRGRARPNTFGGGYNQASTEKEQESQKSKRYPHTFPNEGTRMHKFLTNKSWHVYITLVRPTPRCRASSPR
jgi:hypothetical protein